MTVPSPALDTVSDTPDATLAIARALAAQLAAGDVVLLEGPLGAGKTHFVRGLAEGLGLDPSAVSSPTFVLMQRYGGDDVDLVHVDLYRVEGPDDLDSMGWTFPPSPEAKEIVAVEWPERLGDERPSNVITVRLDHVDAQRRRITITVPSTWEGRELASSPTSAVTCRRCGKPVDEAFTPFCSSRCRLLDLGAWLSESYQINRPLDETDLL